MTIIRMLMMIMPTTVGAMTTVSSMAKQMHDNKQNKYYCPEPVF